MPNGKSSAATLELDVPTYLPVSDVAEKYNFSEKAVIQMIRTGQIEAVRLPSGELLVPNSNLSLTMLELDVPTYLSLSEAAEKYNLSEKALTQLIQAGKIEAVQLSSGELLVPKNNVPQKVKTKEQIITERFDELRKQPITVSEASKKYRVVGGTIREWISLDYIQVVDDSYPMKVDEAEVAYCAEIFHERKAAGVRSGAPLLDEYGLPYKLKHPKLSAYRRRRKREKQKRN